MSKFEDYESASRNYDDLRFPMGVDVIAALIPFYSGKPLKDMHVLDSGCGTGNYAKALLDYGVGHITLLDASNGMLERAREKMADEISSGKVKEVVRATMPPLPFSDATFDVVMYNMVLHHLVNDPDGENFPQIEKVLQEARRVVKPDGVISITTGEPPSAYENIWFVHLNKDIATRHAKHYPHGQQWHDIFRKSGFRSVCSLQLNVDVPDKVLNTLRDPEGPTRKEWRDSNSYWVSATDEEIKKIEKKISTMKAEGTLEQFVHKFDKCSEFSVVPLFIARPI